MTKIFPASDLHVDWMKDEGIALIDSFPGKNEVDIGVIAGDVCESDLLEQTIILLANHFNHLVYVTGNHEYYRSDWLTVENILRALVNQLDNFTWLDDDRVNIDGVNFIGGTLWFPKSHEAYLNKHFLSDYRLIQQFEPEVYQRNEDTIQYLGTQIREGDVVVTHHTPSHQSISARFKNHALNCYFHNDLDFLIESYKPAVWIHGHTHSSFDYDLGDTRVICNPHGYLKENHYGFQRDLIVEV